MKISYDYSEMIKELKDELADGILTITDNIQVLRAEQAIENGYRPIIDWYYDSSKMIGIETDQYMEDKKTLELIMIANCLIEMEEYNKLI